MLPSYCFCTGHFFLKSAFIDDSTSALGISASQLNNGSKTGQVFTAGISFNGSFDLSNSTARISVPKGKSYSSVAAIEGYFGQNMGTKLILGLGVGMTKNEYENDEDIKSPAITFEAGLNLRILNSQSLDLYIDSLIGYTKLVNRRIGSSQCSNAALQPGLPFIFKTGKSVKLYL